MRKIQNYLVVGIRMDGRHGAEKNFEVVINDFHDGRQTICGAGSVRNNVVLGRVINLLINSKHERNIFVLGGRRNDDFFYRPANMFLGVIGIGKMACGFEHNLGADRIPWKFGRIPLGENLESLVVYGNAVRSSRDLIMQVAENGIIFEQVRQRLGTGEIVNCHHFDVRIIERRPKNIATDASKAVNPYFNSHLASMMIMKKRPNGMWGREPENVNRERLPQQMSQTES